MNLDNILSYLKQNKNPKILFVSHGQSCMVDLLNYTDNGSDSSVSVSINNAEISFFWNNEENRFWLSKQTFLIFPEARISSTIYIGDDKNISSWPKTDILILTNLGNPFTAESRQFLIQAKTVYPNVVVVGNFRKKTEPLQILGQELGVHFLYRSKKIIADVEIVSCLLLNNFENAFFDHLDEAEDYIYDYQFLRDTLRPKNYPRLVITAGSPPTQVLNKLNLDEVVYWYYNDSETYQLSKYQNTIFTTKNSSILKI